MATTTRRLGRPLTPAQPEQRSILSSGDLRMVSPPTLKNRLIDAAKGSARSLSAEMQARLEASFQDDDTFGGVRAAAFWRAIASDAVAEVGPDWLLNPQGILDVFDLVKRNFEAMQGRFDDVGWMIAVAQRALDAFEREGRPVSLAVARQALDASYTMGAPRMPQLLPLRDGLRDIVGHFEEMMADYQRMTGKEALDPEVIALIARQRRRTGPLPSTTATVSESTTPMPTAAPEQKPMPTPMSEPAPPLFVESPVGQSQSEEAVYAKFAWDLAARFSLERFPVTDAAELTKAQIAGVLAGDEKLVALIKLTPPQTATSILRHFEMLATINEELARALQPVETAKTPAVSDPEKA